MRARSYHLLLSLAALTASLAANSPALAAVDCGSIPNAVVVTGSTAIKPLLAELAKVLVVPAAPGAQPVSVLYASTASCVGVDAILNGTKVTSASLVYWDSTGTEQTCTLDMSLGGIPADVGVSDVFASTCFPLPNGLPANVQDFTGPVQTMTFVVPHASSEQSISAEAAYYVYGFGSESGVAPWTNESLIFRRSEQSGTQRMISKAIGVDPGAWRGVQATSSSDLRQQVIAAGNQNPQAAIGILAADEAEANRATLNVLAFQDFGKSCAFYPDRDATSTRKRTCGAVTIRSGARCTSSRRSTTCSARRTQTRATSSPTSSARRRRPLGST